MFTVLLLVVALGRGTSSFSPHYLRPYSAGLGASQARYVSRSQNHQSRSPMPTALASDSLEPDGPEIAITKSITPEIALVWAVPPFAAMVSFFTYTDVTHAFRAVVDVAAGNTWKVADGGKLLSQIITPAVNGPVMATISILFATMVAMTISTLYQRQVELHGTFSREVNELRRLALLMEGLPEPYRQEAKAAMDSYVMHIYRASEESRVTVDIVQRGNTDELFQLLTRISKAAHEDTTLASSTIISTAFDSLVRVEDEKTNYITLLQSTFPVMHYVNLSLLAFSICTVYLLETDQDVILFLAAFQLKFLWAVLNGVFATIATIIYDLNNPFGGSYSVWLQLHVCRAFALLSSELGLTRNLLHTDHLFDRGRNGNDENLFAKTLG